MKSYTDLEQSKKLAEILQIESADMLYNKIHSIQEYGDIPLSLPPAKDTDLPCWSLAALLNVLPSSTLDSSDDHYYRLHCMERFSEWYDNPVDACCELIIKLHKEGLL